MVIQLCVIGHAAFIELLVDGPCNSLSEFCVEYNTSFHFEKYIKQVGNDRAALTHYITLYGWATRSCSA